MIAEETLINIYEERMFIVFYHHYLHMNLTVTYFRYKHFFIFH